MANNACLKFFDLTEKPSWIRSSYSNAGQNCVEAKRLAPRSPSVAVRDSKQSNGPAITVPHAAWISFIRGVQVTN
ncbi:DUF397 domain-containing protein [Streptomyces blastmyceticus]|uniref:DUF397 domain-containing protein n=1 Tax=Streptomyces blastmyceticus TaxID=68180 RepID=A0ABN0WKB7_9ACTN